METLEYLQGSDGRYWIKRFSIKSYLLDRPFRTVKDLKDTARELLRIKEDK